MKLKKIFFSIMLLLALMMSLGVFIYGCSSDETAFIDKTSTLTGELDNLNCRPMLVDSIAESDEFLDFVMSCNLLSDKIDEYISTLSQEEKEELINNANNDDYVQNIENHVDIKEESESISVARDKLFTNTSFLQLNELEKSILFDELFVMQECLIKTRGGEGGDKEACEKAKKEAYQRAYNNFIRRLSLCDYLSPEDKYACQIGTKLNYEAEKGQADTEYKRCIGK